ncbi:ArsI/CadI family heavy metal resistance metalloenzyme [Reichenbachiella ulvae]|uniref:VOC family protein n=1 Tax=Reichenbachiella ulvae TaxID=2980104 RepID=A0ABT3CQG3_9BACT|nr:ArsI/CadI family heavy metal resistance metalloenzyme [Reichenbachiella ulvae]MCV9385862.1 VOC family protein [Reichenbachiella ulvae]
MNNSNFPRMHVSFYVSDITSTVNFYSTFFGKPANKIRKGYAKYVLDAPALIISFIENKDRVNSAFGHLGFQVETKEEMEERLSIAQKQGIVDREEIGTSCCYAVQDKFWVNDPDGYQWEVYYFHKDAEFNDPKYDEADASACCIVTETVESKPKLNLSEIKKEEASCEPGSGCC